MKVNKTICLSEENVEKLKHETNASELIDQLLSKHYQSITPSNLTPEERDKRIEILKKKIDLRKQMEALDAPNK